MAPGAVVRTHSVAFPPKHATMSWRRPVSSGLSFAQELSAGPKKIKKKKNHMQLHNNTQTYKWRTPISLAIRWLFPKGIRWDVIDAFGCFWNGKHQNRWGMNEEESEQVDEWICMRVIGWGARDEVDAYHILAHWLADLIEVYHKCFPQNAGLQI